MGGIVIVAQLPTVGGEARQEYIRRLTAASGYAISHEPGVLKYAIFAPRDQSDEKSVWVIEQYATKEAFDSHMATTGVQDMIKWMTSNPVLEGAPTVHQIEFIDNLSFARPEVAKASDLYISFAALDYIPDGVAQSLPYWQAVVDTTEKEEPGSLVYGICKDPSNPQKLYTVEAYESEEYLWGVHAKSKAIEESIKNTKHLRTGLKHVFLRLVAGYLWKPEEGLQAQL